MFKTIIIAVFLIIAANSAFSKNIQFSFTPADSVVVEKQNSPLPEKFDIYIPKDMFTSWYRINIDIPENSTVSMKLYNYDNKFISELFNNNFEPGTYYFNPYAFIRANSFDNGVYFLEMKTGNFSKQKKIIYVK